MFRGHGIVGIDLPALEGLHKASQAVDLDKHLSEIPKNKLIVLVSNHAGRAGTAADLLENKRFEVAGAVGAQVYESEGGKLTKVEPPQAGYVGEEVEGLISTDGVRGTALTKGPLQ